MPKPSLVAGLEIGTRSFTLAVGQMVEPNRLVVRSLESLPAQGFQKGVLTDPIECSDTVARLVRQAEKSISNRITKVFVAIQGNHIRSFNASASVPIANPGVGISKRDVERALFTCRSLNLDYDRQVLHSFERSFAVDGQAGIKDAIGLYGNKLTAEIHLVTALNLAIQNFLRVINRAGVEVQELVLPALAASEAVLSDLDRDLGVTLIRLGESQSEAVIFTEGSARESFLVPWGTDYLAEGLTRVLKLPRATVEQLLEQLQSLEEKSDWVGVPLQARAGSMVRSLPQGQLVSLVVGKVKEFLGRIRHQLEESPYFRESAAGVVMVGELPQREGFLEMAEDVLNMPVRLGMPRDLQLDPSVQLRASSLTAVGLLYHATKTPVVSTSHPVPTTFWGKCVDKTRRIFEEYF